MIQRLNNINQSAWFWLGIIGIGLAMEAVALFYQYGLDYGPCTLCSHVRAWILGGMMLAVLGFLVRRQNALNGLAHLGLLGMAGGLLYSSWQTLGVERGFIFSSCELGSGFPSWLPLHEWWPSIFEATELCGYTPYLLFGVTMAEALVVVAAATILALSVSTLASLARAVRGSP
ncbi:MAG: disulfide bond formation protein B [Xanthomonadales bacterium]|nr:disulfide bond formation protein B [Xanthomonadales bacterium]